MNSQICTIIYMISWWVYGFRSLFRYISRDYKMLSEYTGLHNYVIFLFPLFTYVKVWNRTTYKHLQASLLTVYVLSNAITKATIFSFSLWHVLEIQTGLLFNPSIEGLLLQDVTKFLSCSVASMICLILKSKTLELNFKH